MLSSKLSSATSSIKLNLRFLPPCFITSQITDISIRYHISYQSDSISSCLSKLSFLLWLPFVKYEFNFHQVYFVAPFFNCISNFCLLPIVCRLLARRTYIMLLYLRNDFYSNFVKIFSCLLRFDHSNSL